MAVIRGPEGDCSIMVTVHYYSPMAFTYRARPRQAMETRWAWSGGALEEHQAVLQDIDKAQTWAESNGRPLYLGEFGVYDKADMASRVLPPSNNISK